MASYRRHEILSGVFILLAVLVFALFAFNVGHLHVLDWMKGRVFECVAYFDDVRSLNEGAKVVVGGLEVGRVTSISLVDASNLHNHFDQAKKSVMGIEVKFEIHMLSLSLNEDEAAVSLAKDGFLGTHFLRLDPAWPAKNAPASLKQRLDDADFARSQPALIRVKVGDDLDGLIEGAQGLMRKAQPILASLEEILDTIQSDVVGDSDDKGVRQMLTKLNSSIDEAQDFLGRLNLLMDPQSATGLHHLILNPANKLLGDLDTEMLEISAELKGRIMKQVKGLLGRGQAFVDNANGAVSDARKILADADPKIGGILTDLQASVKTAKEALAALKQDSKKLLDGFNGIVVENRVNIREMLRRFRRTAWQFEMAIRKVRANPAFLIFGDDGKDLEATSVDEGRIRRSGRARPYGQRDEGDGK